MRMYVDLPRCLGLSILCNEGDFLRVCFEYRDTHHISCTPQTDSISSVLYSGSEEMAMHFFPAGALEAWLTNDRIAPLNPEVMTEQEKEIRDRIFAKEAGGYRGPTNWYRVLVRGLDADDEKGLDPKIPCPALMIAEKESKVSIPGMVEGMGRFADDFRMKSTSTIGHWVQLEAKDEVNQMLEEFLKGLEG